MSHKTVDLGAETTYEDAVAIVRYGDASVLLGEEEAWRLAWTLIGFCIEHKEKQRERGDGGGA
jgi:hypothetical protein